MRTFIISCISLFIAFILQAQTPAFTYYDSSNGFLDEQVIEMFFDSQNRLWLGTEFSGIYVYENDSLTHYDKDEYGLLSDYPSSFAEDSEGNIWIGFYHEAYGGVMKFDGLSFTEEYTTSDEIPIGRVVDIIIDQENEDELYVLEAVNNYHTYTLNIIQEDTIISHYFGETGGGVPRDVGDMLKASDGKIWLACHREGVFVYEEGVTPQTVLEGGFAFEYFDALSGSAYKERAYSLAEDSLGRIWINRGEDGLIVADADLSYWEYFPSQIYSTSSPGINARLGVLPGNRVKAVFTDSNGTTWCVVTKGNDLGKSYLSRFENGAINNQLFYNETISTLSFNENQVFEMLEDTAQNLWITTPNSLLKIANLDSLKQAASDTSIIQQAVTSISVVDTSSIYNFGHWIDSAYTYCHYHALNGFTDDKVFAIHAASDGKIWLGTENNGLYSFENDTFTRYHLYKNELCDSNHLYGEFYDFAEDSEGNIWIANWDEEVGGVYKYDGESLSLAHVAGKNSLSSRYAISLYMDSTDALWVGTGGRRYYTSGLPLDSGGLHIFRSDTTLIYAEKLNATPDINCITDIVPKNDGTGKVGIISFYEGDAPYCEMDSLGNLEEINIPLYETINNDWLSSELKILFYNGFGFGGEMYDIALIGGDGSYKYNYNGSGEWGGGSYPGVSEVFFMLRDHNNNIWEGVNISGYYRIRRTGGGEIFKDYSVLPVWSAGGTQNQFDIRKIGAAEDINHDIWAGALNGVVRIIETPIISANEVNNTALSVQTYPNPANDVLHIILPSIANYHYQLFNSQGALVRSGKWWNDKNQLQLSGLSSGLYCLKINNGKQFYTNKVMIN